MDDLAYELVRLCRRNRDGSFQTQGQRMRSLTLTARQLKAAGFRDMRASSLKAKHVDALLAGWRADGLSPRTIANRMAHLRWWAEKTGKASIIPASNAALGIPARPPAGSGGNKAQELDGDRLAKVADPYIRMSLQLQRAFGLRREEAIKLQPAYADKGDHIALMGSWCKGGRSRIIPITTLEQRVLLDQTRALAGSGSLIPANKEYVQQRDAYGDQCGDAELDNMHGLRHAYAQSRYEALTGWKAPIAGGPTRKMLTPDQRAIDAQARQAISRELGHERPQVASHYLGR